MPETFSGDVMDRNYDVITFSQNVFILRGPRVAMFGDIIKIVTIFIKKTCKDSKNKARRIRTNVPKSNRFLFFLI